MTLLLGVAGRTGRRAPCPGTGFADATRPATPRLGWGALVLVIAGSCIPRSLDELEQQGRSTCDPMHPCVMGWHCGTDGFCAKDVSGGTCNDGDTMSCGSSSTGECRKGTISCSGAMWGTCMGAVEPVQEVCDNKDNDCDGMTDDNAVDAMLCPLHDAGVCAGKHAPCGQTACGAATYGADYELTEAACDGKDNDCDGLTDESLSQLCTEQRGECAGARSSCLGGSYPACGPTVFSANKATWEPYEQTCDGLDNDCDGLVDSWVPQNISQTGLRSKNPAVGVASSAPDDLVVVWEEESGDGGAPRGIFKVRSRVVHKDGSLTGANPPSSTASAAYRSWAPSIATDGTQLVAAWAEEVSMGGPKRIALASLDPSTALSNLTGMGAFAPLSGTEVTQPDEVAVALDATGARAFIAVVDMGALKYAAAVMPLSLAMTQYKKTNEGITGISHVRVAPAGNRSFWLTYETAIGQVQRCLVDDTGTRTCAATTPLGRYPNLSPLTSAMPFAANSFYQAVDGGTADYVWSATCVDGGTCTGPTLVSRIPPQTAMAGLKVAAPARNAVATVFTWEESSGATPSVRFFNSNRDAGVQPGGSNAGHRPQPVFLGMGAALRGAVVFDSDGTSGPSIAGDEIYVLRFCY